MEIFLLAVNEIGFERRRVVGRRDSARRRRVFVIHGVETAREVVGQVVVEISVDAVVGGLDDAEVGGSRGRAKEQIMRRKRTED